jgi:type IX secretion system PorP/SprF family membrane protein
MRKSITILLLCWSAAAFGQLQPQITQHMYNPMPFNPATAGYREALSGTISHRQLWRAFDGTPTTYTLGIHAPVFNPSFGAGLLVQHDEIGVSRSLGVAAQFAYRMRTGKSGKLCFGLKAGVINQLDKWSAVITTDTGDDAFTIGDTQSWLPDVGAGIYYYRKKYYAGFSVPTFFSRRYEGAGVYAPKFAPVESTFVLHTGGVVDLSKSLNIQPSLLARYQQAAGYQIEMGAMFNLKERFGLDFSLGLAGTLLAFALLVGGWWAFGEVTATLWLLALGMTAYNALSTWFEFRYVLGRGSVKRAGVR